MRRKRSLGPEARTVLEVTELVRHKREDDLWGMLSAAHESGRPTSVPASAPTFTVEPPPQPEPFARGSMTSPCPVCGAMYMRSGFARDAYVAAANGHLFRDGAWRCPQWNP